MNITPELVAELIFKISTLRYLEREYEKNPNFDNRNDMIKYQAHIDDFLVKHEWFDYMTKQDIFYSITEESKLKKEI